MTRQARSGRKWAKRALWPDPKGIISSAFVSVNVCVWVQIG